MFVPELSTVVYWVKCCLLSGAILEGVGGDGGERGGKKQKNVHRFGLQRYKYEAFN
jgi:hypothetical protein